MIFWCPPRTAGYAVMRSPDGTGIDEACPSVRNTNRINTGLNKVPSAPGQDRAEGLVRTDRGEGADGPWDDASDAAGAVGGVGRPRGVVRVCQDLGAVHP